jgi:multidrug efflux pump subunit AcrB
MQALATVLLIPVSFIGLFLTYYMTGVPFGTGGFAAMVLLAGLTVNAGIYIICQNNNQREMYLLPAELDKKRLLKISCTRYVKAFNHKIIPILLTILSTVLGMIPFLIDGPDEQPFWYSLAIGTIGGLLFSVIPIYLFLPCVLRLCKR